MGVSSTRSTRPRCLLGERITAAGSTSIASRLISGYATNIGWIFPLDPFTEDNGPMEIMPRSFTEAEKPSEDEFAPACLSLAGLAPGDACCFNARCWHRGGQNSTSAWRHAVTVNVTRSYIRQQFDYPRMVDRRVLERLDDDSRRFLGCFVECPFRSRSFRFPPTSGLTARARSKSRVPRLSIITAFLNEEENLPQFRRRVEAAATSLASLHGDDFDYEVVLVDDHSTDSGERFAAGL